MPRNSNGRVGWRMKGTLPNIRERAIGGVENLEACRLIDSAGVGTIGAMVAR